METTIRLLTPDKKGIGKRLAEAVAAAGGIVRQTRVARRMRGMNELVSVWLDRARENASRCFICDRIAKANSSGAVVLQAIRISGVEMNAETQISHLCRCVGEGNDPPGGPQGR